MKQCPSCNQTFSDDTHFCLSDGTPLVFLSDATEEVTVVRPAIFNNQLPPEPKGSKGISSILLIFGGGVILLFMAVAVLGIIFFVLSRDGDPRVQNPSNNGQIIVNKEKDNLKEQQDELERERKRLADERKKLNEEKNKPIETPSRTPIPASSYPPQPTARIKFGRGRVAESISGVVYKQRSFVLEARSGQYLSAIVNGGGCVTFSNGSTTMGYVTNAGDNSLTVINKCDTEARFSITVSIK